MPEAIFENEVSLQKFDDAFIIQTGYKPFNGDSELTMAVNTNVVFIRFNFS